LAIIILHSITGVCTPARLLAASISVETVTPPVWDWPWKISFQSRYSRSGSQTILGCPKSPLGTIFQGIRREQDLRFTSLFQGDSMSKIASSLICALAFLFPRRVHRPDAKRRLNSTLAGAAP